jgi:23S rRNA (pseudouridine1915-N3)-methyltransferase
MFRITVIAPSDMKEAYFRDACAEYAKRISAFAELRFAEYDAARLPDDPSDREIDAALAAEAPKIMRLLPPRARKFALCIEGTRPDSAELAAIVAAARDDVGEAAFVIGSSCGLHKSVKDACDARISLSALTLPHRLARVVLLEALYRSLSISAGRKYHK